MARGQSEAAFAVGLTRRQTFLLVVLPQVLPLALPGLGNLWLVVLKESSLVSLIGFTELGRSMRGRAAPVGQTPDRLQEKRPFEDNIHVARLS